MTKLYCDWIIVPLHSLPSPSGIFLNKYNGSNCISQWKYQLLRTIVFGIKFPYNWILSWIFSFSCYCKDFPFIVLFPLLDHCHFLIGYPCWFSYKFYCQGWSYINQQSLIAIFSGILSDCYVWPYPLCGSVPFFLGHFSLGRTGTP